MDKPIDLSPYLVDVDAARILPAEQTDEFMAALPTVSGTIEGTLTDEAVEMVERWGRAEPAGTLTVKGENFTARVTGYVQRPDGSYMVDLQVDDPEQKARLRELFSETD